MRGQAKDGSCQRHRHPTSHNDSPSLRRQLHHGLHGSGRASRPRRSSRWIVRPSMRLNPRRTRQIVLPPVMLEIIESRPASSCPAGSCRRPPQVPHSREALGCWGPWSNRIQTAPVPDLAFHVRRLGVELAPALDDHWHLDSRSGVDLIFGISTPPFSPLVEKSQSAPFLPGSGLSNPISKSRRRQACGIRGAGFGMEDMDKLRHGQGGDRPFAAPHPQNTRLLSPRRDQILWPLPALSPGVAEWPSMPDAQSNKPPLQTKASGGWVGSRSGSPHCPTVVAKAKSVNDWPALQ